LKLDRLQDGAVHVFGVESEVRSHWANGVKRLLDVKGASEGVTEKAATPALILLVFGPDNQWKGDWEKLHNILSSGDDNYQCLLVLSEATPGIQKTVGVSPDLFLQSIIASFSEDQESGVITWVGISDLVALLSSEDGPERIAKIDGPGSQICRLSKALERLSTSVGDRFTEEFVEERGGEDLDKLRFIVSDIRVNDFMDFHSNPIWYQTRSLHGAIAEDVPLERSLSETERKTARQIALFKYLHAYVSMPPRTNYPKLNILVVENAAKKLLAWVNGCQDSVNELGFDVDGRVNVTDLPGVKWYMIDDEVDFNMLKTDNTSKRMRAKLSAGQLVVDSEEERDIPWNEIDLVLQDIMLGENADTFTGLNLVHNYQELCPQALVFIITGMDVESLAVSGKIDWGHVDAVIPKRRLETLWWEYERCFKEKIGRMFWPDWIGEEIDDENPDQTRIDTRADLRHLFASLRRWRREPAILGHGQAVAEMVDHADRHCSCLWKLADDVVGEYLDNAPSKTSFPIEDRMYLAMAIWLHDLGHRGDEYHDDSGSVRMYHAGISERLILSDPEAFELDWLLGKCKMEKCRSIDAKSRQKREEASKRRLKECRNHTPSADENAVCPLRVVGLLCRHHQSNSPLTKDAIKGIQQKGKTLSPYVRGAVYLEGDINKDCERDLENWVDSSEPLVDWQGSEVHSLDGFLSKRDSLLGVAGLLRMLDAIQFHRARVGSPSAVKSFNAYLKHRSKWATRQIDAVEKDLSKMVPGTHEYLTAIQKRQKLEKYRYLVNVQPIHFWQQLMVESVEVAWSWTGNQNGEINVGYVLNDWALEQFRNYRIDLPAEILGEQEDHEKPDIEKLFDLLEAMYKDDIDKWESGAGKELNNFNGEEGRPSDTLRRPLGVWAIHSIEEYIKKEHESQLPAGGGMQAAPYLDPIRPCGFTTSILGLGSYRFDSPLILF